MDYNNESIRTIAEMEALAEKKVNGNAERWLDVACVLDYITLKEKEAVVALLRKQQSSTQKNENFVFGKSSYAVLNRMKEIIKNTTFPLALLRTVR